MPNSREWRIEASHSVLSFPSHPISPISRAYVQPSQWRQISTPNL